MVDSIRIERDVPIPMRNGIFVERRYLSSGQCRKVSRYRNAFTLSHRRIITLRLRSGNANHSGGIGSGIRLCQGEIRI
jgi:hypothetical protein